MDIQLKRALINNLQWTQEERSAKNPIKDQQPLEEYLMNISWKNKLNDCLRANWVEHTEESFHYIIHCHLPTAPSFKFWLDGGIPAATLKFET